MPVYINGRKLTNPVAVMGIKLAVQLAVAAAAALVFLVILPAIGIVVVGAAGLAFAVAVPALLLAPLLAVGGSLLGILLTPLALLVRILRPRPKYYREWE